MIYNPEFIRKIPKTDLHLHLDGSLRIPTLIELAKDNNVDIPSRTDDGLRELIFKEKYASLDEYLKGFAVTCSVLQTADALERSSYELALDNFLEGVRYIEVRFAPQLHINDSMDLEAVLQAVDTGLKKARTEINSRLQQDEPPFEYGIIVCAMRFCNEKFSAFYKNFFNIHKYSNKSDIIKQLSLELARGCVHIRDNSDIQIVAFDLAGAEHGHPAEKHIDAYQYVHKNFMMKTVHAGEAYGPESIFQAITHLHADRIGHGLFLFSAEKISDEKIIDKQEYINKLADYIAEKRITLEVCLTSNLQTVPEIKSYSMHPMKQMLENKLSITLCTDNRLISNTSVCREIEIAVDNFNLTPDELKNIVIYGYKRCFFHKPYHEKREYVRKMINYYEKIEKEYFAN